jgi:hypothetical protein
VLEDCELTEELLSGVVLLCDWLLTAPLVPGVVWAAPVLGVWSSGRAVGWTGSGVALVAGGFSGVLVEVEGVATLPAAWPVVELDWLLLVEGTCELCWSGVVADPATPPVVVEAWPVAEFSVLDVLEEELGEAMLPEAPAALWSAAAPEPRAAEPGPELELEQVEARWLTLVTLKTFPDEAEEEGWPLAAAEEEAEVSALP